MAEDSPAEPLSAETLRKVAWEIGQHESPYAAADFLAFVPIRSGLAYLNWSLAESSVRDLHEREGEAFNGASQTLRVFDVSMVEFDGTNAHNFFDIHVEGLAGHHYLSSDVVDRTLLAEVGFRLIDGRWLPLARSQSVFMVRNHRAGHSSTEGLYVAGRFDRVFPVENVYDAPVFNRMHAAWSQDGLRALLVEYLETDTDPENARRLTDYLGRLHDSATRFEVAFRAKESGDSAGSPDIVHGHNVEAIDWAVEAAAKAGAPFVFSLHNTEWERAGLMAREPDQALVEKELEGVRAADVVIVPHGDTRDQLLAVDGIDGEKIAILPDLFESTHPRAFDPGEVKMRFHLNPAHPLALFSGEVSHAAGADLLVDAILHVSGGRGDAQFVLIGEGPLRGELEGRVHHAGLGDRVRFVGDVGHDVFVDLMAACEFVVIPARTWQDEGLAHAALEAGKPVVATHQSRIHCVRHGENGLMAYDNPNSIIWAVQEMFAQPFHTAPGGIMRRPQQDRRSLESVAAELSALYRSVLGEPREGGNS